MAVVKVQHPPVTDDVMHVVLKCSLVCVTFYKRGWLILNFQFNLVHEGK